MAKDAASAMSSLGAQMGMQTGQGNSANRRKLGSGMSQGNPSGQTTYSQYMKPTSTGTQTYDRSGQGENINQNGNTSTGMGMYNPYSFMGGYNSWMSAPNAMDSFSSRYGPGATPEWAKPVWKPDYVKEIEAQKAATQATPAATTTPAAGLDSNAALNQLNAGLKTALTPAEVEQLKGAVGFTGGNVTPDQMAKAQALIKQYKPESVMGGF